MTKEITPEIREKKNAGVRRWYKENREQYNLERRRKYAFDGQTSKDAVNRSREYRSKAKGKPVSRSIYLADKNGAVELFSSGTVAQKFNRTAQTLRSWETRQWIPRPHVEGLSQRFYTREQIDLIKKIVDFIDEHKGSTTSPEFEAVVEEVHQNWGA